jgi:2'-hydroxyisoflavone reductase
LRAANSGARITWVDEAFLLASEVGPWMELPLWIPQPKTHGILNVDTAKAQRAGLRIRSLDDTAAATLAWLDRRGDAPLGAGLEAQRERELLAAWHAQAFIHRRSLTGSG